jgi:hypothetical protein
VPAEVLGPSLALVALAGCLVVAVYGLTVATPGRQVFYLLPAGLVGALVGQIVGTLLTLPGPTIGSLHVLESLLGAWLLVSSVRRMVV